MDAALTLTIEAFADTIIPGEKRFPGDRAVAGAAEGGGAVAAGALVLLRDPAGGLAPALDSLAVSLNDHATRYAGGRALPLDDDVPAFVALPFADRTALVEELTAWEHPEHEMWVGLALFSNMAFDSAAHLHTAEAFAAGHPGLLTLGYAPPGPDGVWQFPSFSYGRELALPHPGTTATGSPS
ncbi:DUF5987 family protein [Catenuloplanes sp. NPDC051500]|uniref:DUF5987 family protein n=1 Tax=Catenuloplanes sp. NPDC051500 TaxID=3363959 RepID=UPI0037A567A6